MEQIVKVVFNQVLKVNCVDARELHAALKVRTHFKDWIVTRLDDVMAQSNVDFIATGKAVGENIEQLEGENVDTMAQSNVDSFIAEKKAMENIEQLEGKNVGGIAKHKRKDYKLSITIAKEMAMLERNDVGKEVRKYFIKCEEELRNKVYRTKGDDLSVLARVVNKIATEKRFELEGKTDHEFYYINIAKVENKLAFGYHEKDIRRNITQAQQARLNKVLEDVAILAAKGITNPTKVFETLSPKYPKLQLGS